MCSGDSDTEEEQESDSGIWWMEQQEVPPSEHHRDQGDGHGLWEVGATLQPVNLCVINIDYNMENLC